jgi:copper chaperone CopZ
MRSTTIISIEGSIALNGRLEKALEEVPGVQAVQLDLEHKCAIIQHEGADTKRLVAAAAEEGLQATLL